MMWIKKNFKDKKPVSTKCIEKKKPNIEKKPKAQSKDVKYLKYQVDYSKWTWRKLKIDIKKIDPEYNKGNSVQKRNTNITLSFFI